MSKKCVTPMLNRAAIQHLPGGFFAGFREGFKKPLPILVIFEDRVLPIPATHYVVDRPGTLDAQLPSHRHRLPKSGLPVNRILQYD